MADMCICVGCGCSLLLIYVFFLYLRAPRKIDSSIGLPSLNKVVSYLLTYLLRTGYGVQETKMFVHNEMK